METSRKKLISRETVQRYGAVVMFFALYVFNAFYTKGFFTWRIFWNLIIQASPAILVAFGMTLVIATGNINISVGSMMGLGGVIFAYFVKRGGSPMLWLAVSLALGAAVGALLGVIVSKFKVQSMIATMSGMYILRGVARVIANGSQISYNNASVSALSYYRVGGVVPLQAVVVLAILAILYIFVTRARYGVQLEASGNNQRAAHLAGINTVAVITLAYVICQTLSSLAGIGKMITVSSADGTGLGLNYEFDAIAAVVVGGTPMAGGRPNIIGTLFAALLLQTIEIMVNMNGIYYAIAQIIKALIIMIAVYSQYAGTKEK